MFPPGPPRANS